jgi:hypothetical protein
MLLRSIRRKSSAGNLSTLTPVATPKRNSRSAGQSNVNAVEPQYFNHQQSLYQLNLAAGRFSPISTANQMLTVRRPRIDRTNDDASDDFESNHIPRAFSTHSISTRLTLPATGAATQWIPIKQTDDINRRSNEGHEGMSRSQVAAGRRLTLTQELLAGAERSHAHTSLSGTSKHSSLDFSRVHVNPLDPLNCSSKPRARSESTLPIIEQYVYDHFFETQ